MKEKAYVTPQGLQQLKEEYEELVKVKRPEVASKIEQARSLGDLSENAAYHQIRREQSFIEGRIAELEEILKNAEVIENREKGVVNLGSRVKVEFDGQKEELIIVGEVEANHCPDKISNTSPLGKALVGHEVGEVIVIEAPGGKLEYKIVGIE